MRNWLLKYFIACLVVVAGGMTAVMGQMNTNSPYTRYGYGQLVEGTTGRSQAMGDIAIGLYSPLHVNPVNPATYTSTDSTTFLFDIGISGLVSNFKSGGAEKNTFTGRLDYVAFQTPITKWLGASVGLIPYSYIGYNYNIIDSVALPGNDKKQIYEQTYQGTGGVNQVFLGLTFNIKDYVTIGANGYYMFGNLDHYRTMQYTSSDLINYYTIYRSEQHINNFNGRFGIQYHQPIGKNHMLTLGAIYEFRSPLYGTYNISMLGVDTVTAEVKSKDYFELPQTWGVGFSYVYKKRLTIGADFSMYEFGNAKFANVKDTLGDRMKIAVGAEYINNPIGRNYADRMYWRLGANLRSSYIKTNQGQLYDFSITMGIGFPLRTSRTIINFNMEYGRIGSEKYTKLAEQYFKFGFSFSLNEMWFVKNKIR